MMRSSLAHHLVRIDHIGFTALPGLAAKPIIDIQFSGHALEPMVRYQPARAACGFQ
jgi:GrpB-like predicted nucleotidyltransferase (UPF0157 family)